MVTTTPASVNHDDEINDTQNSGEDIGDLDSSLQPAENKATESEEKQLKVKVTILSLIKNSFILLALLCTGHVCFLC